MHAQPWRALGKSRIPCGQRVAGRQASEHDAVNAGFPLVLCLHRQRPLWQTHRHKGGLHVLARNDTLSQGQLESLAFLRSRWLDELRTRFDQCFDFGDIQSTTIESDFINLATEQICLGNPTDVHGQFGIVEIGGMDRSRRHLQTVYVQAGFSFTTLHHRGDMLPAIIGDHPRRRLHGAVGLIVFISGFHPQDAIPRRHVEHPAMGVSISA